MLKRGSEERLGVHGGRVRNVIFLHGGATWRGGELRAKKIVFES